MPTVRIQHVEITHNGNVNRGIKYIQDHWNNRYIKDLFNNARTSTDKRGSLVVPNVSGYYVLKWLGGNKFSLGWRSHH